MNKNELDLIKDNIFSFVDFFGNKKIEQEQINPYYLNNNETYVDDNFIILDVKQLNYKLAHFYVFYTFNINKNLHLNFILLEYQFKLFIEQNTSVCL